MIARFLLAVAALVALPAPADALLCTPILGCSCSVNATNMVMSPLDPLSGAAATGTADVTVSCTGVIDVAPQVSIKVNGGVHGTIADRQMETASGTALHYNLYTSTLYTTIVGEGVGGFPAITVSGGTLVLGSWNATTHLYGRAPAASAQAPGSYSDTVTVRIDW